MSDCFTLGLACNTTHACNRSGCQLARPGRPVGAGEAPGHGLPDWPEDLRTFDERHAYQRGVTVGKLVGRTEVNDDLMAALKGVLSSLEWHVEKTGSFGMDHLRMGAAREAISKGTKT